MLNKKYINLHIFEKLKENFDQLASTLTHIRNTKMKLGDLLSKLFVQPGGDFHSYLEFFSLIKTQLLMSRTEWLRCFLLFYLCMIVGEIRILIYGYYYSPILDHPLYQTLDQIATILGPHIHKSRTLVTLAALVWITTVLLHWRCFFYMPPELPMLAEKLMIRNYRQFVADNHQTLFHFSWHGGFSAMSNRFYFRKPLQPFGSLTTKSRVLLVVDYIIGDLIIRIIIISMSKIFYKRAGVKAPSASCKKRLQSRQSQTRVIIIQNSMVQS